METDAKQVQQVLQQQQFGGVLNEIHSKDKSRDV